MRDKKYFQIECSENIPGFINPNEVRRELYRWVFLYLVFVFAPEQRGDGRAVRVIGLWEKRN